MIKLIAEIIKDILILNKIRGGHIKKKKVINYWFLTEVIQTPSSPTRIN